MSLNTLYLFSNVRITPDYSVVHDMDPDTWHDFLMGWLDPMPPGADQQIVYSNSLKLNYYRMPDTLRIEGNYDKLKNATYGFLQDGMYNDQQPAKTSFRYIFFWVKDVRLITQRTADHTEGGTTVFDDVVEIELEMDTWSTYGVGAFTLYDSYVERKHMPRWKNTGTDLSPVWEPVYYPNAGQGVEGAYRKEASEDASNNYLGKYNDSTYGEFTVKIFFVQFNVLTTSGQMDILVIPVCLRISETAAFLTNVYPTDAGGTEDNAPFLRFTEFLDGSIFSALGISSVETVQSILVYPYIGDVLDYTTLTFDAYNNPRIHIDTVSLHAPEYIKQQVGGTWRSWFKVQSSIPYMHGAYDIASKSVTVIAPDHDAVPVDEEYLDEHEPMMYLSPARVRKVVTSFGGELFSIPDIAAFFDTVSLKALNDLAAGSVFVFMGEDILESNAIGACGVMECATLPIYNSAWKSYEAINKVGDEISFNAKQMQALANGTAGTASNAIMGGFVGNAAGAIMGAITGIVGTGAAMYGNAEELRAKQVTIKNSPCNVKSTGSGLTASVDAMVTAEYLTLKLDDVSMEKLRFMYYWYGYHVNRTIKGTVDLHTRSKFDYIKTNGAKVRGSLTAGAARQIAAIFDAGVTIYHGADGYVLIGTGDMKENDEI